MRVLIIEDELPSQRMLADLVHKLRPQWVLAGFAGSVSDAVNWFNNNDHPDIIFSDIQLIDGTCFEIFEQVETNASVIFTTAYDEYAIRAFKVNSVDYLLKPVSEKELLAAIEKFESMVNRPENDKPDMKALMENLLTGKVKYRSRLLVDVPDGYVKIDIDDISYFYSSHKVTTVVTFDKKRYVVSLSLDKLENQLDPDVFFRASRQYLLNIESIKKVENWFNGKLIVKLDPVPEENVIVSREKAGVFKEWLDK